MIELVTALLSTAAVAGLLGFVLGSEFMMRHKTNWQLAAEDWKKSARRWRAECDQMKRQAFIRSRACKGECHVLRVEMRLRNLVDDNADDK